jgi:hypothetical protein
VELLQPSEPLNVTLAVLHVLMKSRENPNRGRPAGLWRDDNPTATFQLSRIRELPTIRILAEQLGLSRPGEFSASTVEAIADRICHAAGSQGELSQAFRLDLPAVVQFLEQLAQPPTAGAKEKGTKSPGRKLIDPERTQQIVDAWATGHYKEYSELGRELGISWREVEKAVKRHDMRERRKN